MCEAVATGMAEAADAIVTPALWAACPVQSRLPRHRFDPASTLSLLVTDIVRSLAETGFPKFYFLNAHGANLAPINAALHDLRAEGPALSFRVKSWWSYPETNALRQSLSG